ncbi:MAG: hypothetical protein H6908_06865 [Hyphomicrobiales bacterium]|nr:hypothetical protein [Rickettsiales bacterium]MCP5362333.1 hypothetical protein [Hyphomicrobiales bacterium]
MRIPQWFLLVLIGLTVSACAGRHTTTVTPMQKKDKYLSCNELMLELNEAEFYRRAAEQHKNPDVKSIIMPLGYISTYMNAEEAAQAANARIEYLNRVYEILRCDLEERRTSPYGDTQTPASLHRMAPGAGQPQRRAPAQNIPGSPLPGNIPANIDDTW